MTQATFHRAGPWTFAFVILLTVGAGGLTACASSGVRPDDMSADAHYAAAARERAAAEAAEAKFDPAATRSERVIVDPLAGNYDVRYFNPTAKYRTEAAEHREVATQHVAAATALETFETKQCRALPSDSHGACPLHEKLEAATPIADGVEVTLVPGASADDFMAQVTCHLAFAKTEGYEGMDACPLFLRDVEAEVVDAHTVRFTVDDADLVPELQRRMATHLDAPKRTSLR